MYLLIANNYYGDDSCETILFGVVQDRDKIFQIFEWCKATAAGYKTTMQTFQVQIEDFLKDWQEKNPMPEVRNLPRSPKPKHPALPSELENLSKREKKQLPIYQVYLQTLHKYQQDMDVWKYVDEQLSLKEREEFTAWREQLDSAEFVFRQVNRPQIDVIPTPWKESLQDHLYQIQHADYFEIVEIPIIG